MPMTSPLFEMDYGYPRVGDLEPEAQMLFLAARENGGIYDNMLTGSEAEDDNIGGEPVVTDISE